MNISAAKMNRYKSRMQNDDNRSRSTQARNSRLFNESSVNYANYTKAFVGVKTINDAYKSFGASVLQDIQLFKTTEVTTTTTIEIGKIDSGVIIK